MKIELKKLSLNDGKEIYEMIQEIGPGENGFMNNGYGISYNEFLEYLEKNKNMAEGINLKEGLVPQTIYWLVINEKPVGIGKLRDYLTDVLRKNGGHIGYTIRPSERGKGYGTLILSELLKKAKEKGIEKALLTINEDNILSRKVVEGNGAILEDINEGKCRYWIEIVK